MLLKISQYSQENTCVGGLQLYLKETPMHFPVNIAKFLRTPFFKNTSGGYCYKHVNEKKCMTAFQIISVCNFLEKRDHIFTCMFSCYSTLVSVKNDGYILVLGKNPPGKSPPDPKPNPIPNLTLNITLTPYGGLFPGGIFSWHRIFWIDLPCKKKRISVW